MATPKEDSEKIKEQLSDELYSKDVRLLMGLIQNAEDNDYAPDVQHRFVWRCCCFPSFAANFYDTVFLFFFFLRFRTNLLLQMPFKLSGYSADFQVTSHTTNPPIDNVNPPK